MSVLVKNKLSKITEGPMLSKIRLQALNKACEWATPNQNGSPHTYISFPSQVVTDVARVLAIHYKVSSGYFAIMLGSSKQHLHKFMQSLECPGYLKMFFNSRKIVLRVQKEADMSSHCGEEHYWMSEQ